MIQHQVIIYALGWSVYFLQGGFFPQGGLFTKIICLLLLLLSFYHFIQVNLNYKLPKYFIGLNVLLGSFFLYGMMALFGVTTHPLPNEYLKSILVSMLPIYSFFFFTKKGYLSEKKITILVFVFFVFSIINYYGKIYTRLLVSLRGDIDFTNNSGYLFVPLIAAFSLLKENNVLQYALMSVCLFFSIQSSKRGAIIICVTCLFWFFVNDLQGKSIKQKMGVIFFILIAAIFGYILFDKHLSESYAFQRKIQELEDGRGGNGREDIYSTFIDYQWNGTTPLQFLFGSGANATLDVSTTYAHNDWLEIAVNQGLLGVFVYILYWTLFYREAFVKKDRTMIKLALQLVFIDYFMRTFFSMSYEAMTTSATFVLGYCLAKEDEYE
jgi:hypothetical protein